MKRLVYLKKLFKQLGNIYKTTVVTLYSSQTRKLMDIEIKSHILWTMLERRWLIGINFNDFSNINQNASN